MGQLQWRLWLVWAATFPLGNASGTASSSHSLFHFRHAVLLEGKPQFVEVTYLDSQPIQRYDSKTGRMRPLTLWINQTLSEKYWEEKEFIMVYFGIRFFEKWQDSMVTQRHHNQSKGPQTTARRPHATRQSHSSAPHRTMRLPRPPFGLPRTYLREPGRLELKDHILQCIEGCKLTADGEEIEIHQDAVDGKEMKGEEFHEKKVYLDGNCIRWLKRYLDMKPQMKELPIVKVTHQEVSTNNLQTLTCQAYGFYPKEISASWRKDGGIFNQTNSSVHIVPNSDGTFNARLSIQINPKERKLYRCHVEHVSSSEPLDFLLQKTGPSAEVTTQVLNVNETTLNCSICNFYPEDIYATWMKDGDYWDQETFRGDTIRNWDGTYCTWISIDINPLEEDRYCCYAEHEGLQEALCVKAPTVVIEKNFQPLLIVYSAASVLGILILLSIIIGILCCKKRRRDNRAAAKNDPISSLDNAEKCPLKEIGVQPLQQHC